MIEATVTQEGATIMDRRFVEPGLSLDAVLKRLESYIREEQINFRGECRMKVRFATEVR